MKYTKRFDEVRKDDVALAGGKGANLGELSHAGLPVPPGFVVTTAAYKAFVEAGGLEGGTVGLAPRPRAGDPAAVQAAAGGMRAVFAGGGIPEDVDPETQGDYEMLGQI